MKFSFKTKSSIDKEIAIDQHIDNICQYLESDTNIGVLLILASPPL